MESWGFWHLGDVSDAQLRNGLSELLAAGYRTEARIIAHLAEVEQRNLHLIEGSESLFDYCTRVLHLSNSEAFHRITAARIARKFPMVFELLEQRDLHLTAVCLLRDYLTAENHRELLSECHHKTKWQVQELLARRFPRADVESRIRKLPEPRTHARASVSGQQELGAGSLSTDTSSDPRPSATHSATVSFVDVCGGDMPRTASSPVTGVPAAPSLPVGATDQLALTLSKEAKSSSSSARPIPIEPLSAARYRIQLNASAALKEKLDRLRALTSHSNPSGDIAVVIERALDLALEKVEKQRFAKTDRPRAPRGHFAQTKLKPKQPRLVSQKREPVPNAVLRAVAERDELRWTFRSANGCRCTARAFIQVHHEWPWARGGGETVENLRLLCRLCRIIGYSRSEILARKRSRVIEHRGGSRGEMMARKRSRVIQDQRGPRRATGVARERAESSAREMNLVEGGHVGA